MPVWLKGLLSPSKAASDRTQTWFGQQQQGTITTTSLTLTSVTCCLLYIQAFSLRARSADVLLRVNESCFFLFNLFLRRWAVSHMGVLMTKLWRLLCLFKGYIDGNHALFMSKVYVEQPRTPRHRKYLPRSFARTKVTPAFQYVPNKDFSSYTLFVLHVSTMCLCFLEG